MSIIKEKRRQAVMSSLLFVFQEYKYVFRFQKAMLQKSNLKFFFFGYLVEQDKVM